MRPAKMGNVGPGCQCRCPHEKVTDIDMHVPTYQATTSYVVKREDTAVSSVAGGNVADNGLHQTPTFSSNAFDVGQQWCCPEPEGASHVQAMNRPPAQIGYPHAAAEQQPPYSAAPAGDATPNMSDMWRPPPQDTIAWQQPGSNGTNGQDKDSARSFKEAPPPPAPLSAHGSQMSSGRAGSAQGDARARTAKDWEADQDQFAHLPKLPEGWIRVRSRHNDSIYYCSPATGDTTYTEPTEPAGGLSQVRDTPVAAPVDEDLPAGWEKKVSRTNGRVYYINQQLKVSQYERPTAQ